MMVLLRAISVGMALLLGACASAPQTAAVNPEDPHEAFNRRMHGFNDHVNVYVSKPLVNTYQWLFPDFAELAVANFFTNLKEPRTIANDILQAHPEPAGQDFERFVINTLFGLGGLVNVAAYADIDYHEEDFDQTLAVWGVPRGDYLVLPLLGPSAYRTVPGEIVDAFSSPVSYAGWPLQLLGLLNARSNAEQSLQMIDDAAVDPYVFMKTSYLQWRDHNIYEGQLPDAGLLLPDFDDQEMDELNEDLDVKL